jgi:hypothetical protein
MLLRVTRKEDGFFAILKAIQNVWDWFKWAFKATWDTAIWAWNTGWNVLVLVFTIAWFMVKMGLVALKYALGKLAELIAGLPDLDKTMPSWLVNAFEWLNAAFPVDLLLSFLVLLVALKAAIFVVKFILTHRPRPFGL